ncbi:hypothetical protein [Erwinia persicina]|uniref:hypothetical protein n=1 Tax=Erwinia persicina TaxID=55211 RepID=UPI00177B412F|nr:hypothetical protein [Erwinia persicina]MBD8165087.1 hypothetical protein [Erwinia persicina]
MTDEAKLKIIKERYRSEKKRAKVLSEIVSDFSGSSEERKWLDTLIQQNHQLLREIQTSLILHSLPRCAVIENMASASLRFQCDKDPSPGNVFKNERGRYDETFSVKTQERVIWR